MSKELTFDVLFRDLFNTHSRFGSISEIKIPHPVDIYEDAEGLVFEIACTGLSKKDVDIDIEHDVLKIVHTKQHDEEAQGRVYQTRGIARRSFSLAYKISPKYNLAKGAAEMTNGLLVVQIPFAKQSEPKKLLIQ